MQNTIQIVNKKASYSYRLTEHFTAGLQLKGGEIKSIRNKGVEIKDSYCVLIKSEVWVRNMHVSKYKQDTSDQHNTKRDKKLLLNKSELKKIIKSINEKGMSLIPTKLFINEKGLAKIEIAIGKGKKLYDKREDIKKRDIENQIDREKKKGN